MKGNAVIGQSGGPTSVINSSLAGVVETCLKSKKIKTVLGMNFGIEGFMNEQFFDLGKQGQAVINGLKSTPSSALGSSRHKLQDSDFPKILKILEKYDIRYFFMIGGNDTMDTIHRVEKYCRENHYELFGVGIPKTVDNDLFGTDHTPGWASAARYNMLSVQQACRLAKDMRAVDKFTIYQTIGRDAGWLAAATALGKKNESDGPHLIYMPERHFDAEKFIKDAESCVKANGWVSIVCGEGIKYKDGTPVSQSKTRDKFSNTEFGAMGGASVAINLHRMLKEAFGWRGEFQITESLNMCAIDRARALDLKEAFACGQEAVKLAQKGISGKMVSIERISDKPYKMKLTTVPLDQVAVRAKPMPESFISPSGTGVTKQFLKYASPLVGEPLEFVELKQKYKKRG